MENNFNRLCMRSNFKRLFLVRVCVKDGFVAGLFGRRHGPISRSWRLAGLICFFLKFKVSVEGAWAVCVACRMARIRCAYVCVPVPIQPNNLPFFFLDNLVWNIYIYIYYIICIFMFIVFIYIYYCFQVCCTTVCMSNFIYSSRRMHGCMSLAIQRRTAAYVSISVFIDLVLYWSVSFLGSGCNVSSKTVWLYCSLSLFHVFLVSGPSKPRRWSAGGNWLGQHLCAYVFGVPTVRPISVDKKERKKEGCR